MIWGWLRENVNGFDPWFLKHWRVFWSCWSWTTRLEISWEKVRFFSHLVTHVDHGGPVLVTYLSVCALAGSQCFTHIPSETLSFPHIAAWLPGATPSSWLDTFLQPPKLIYPWMVGCKYLGVSVPRRQTLTITTSCRSINTPAPWNVLCTVFRVSLKD